MGIWVIRKQLPSGAVHHVACRISVPRPGIEPSPPAGEARVLTAGPPEKSQQVPVLGRMVREVLTYMSTFEQGFEEMKGETM